MSIVLLSNVPPSLNEEILRDLFGSSGSIISIVRHSDKCAIAYTESEAATTAKAFDGQNIMGSDLSVQQITQQQYNEWFVEPQKQMQQQLASTGFNNTAPVATSLPSEEKGAPQDEVARAMELVAMMSKPQPQQVQQEKSNEIATELSKTIYVGNLNPLIGETHLREFFSDVGNPPFIKILGNLQHTSRYAFVEFESSEEAKGAFGKSGEILVDRAIKIGPATNPIFKKNKNENEYSSGGAPPPPPYAATIGNAPFAVQHSHLPNSSLTGATMAAAANPLLLAALANPIVAPPNPTLNAFVATNGKPTAAPTEPAQPRSGNGSVSGMSDHNRERSRSNRDHSGRDRDQSRDFDRNRDRDRERYRRDDGYSRRRYHRSRSRSRSSDRNRRHSSHSTRRRHRDRY